MIVRRRHYEHCASCKQRLTIGSGGRKYDDLTEIGERISEPTTISTLFQCSRCGSYWILIEDTDVHGSYLHLVELLLTGELKI